MKIKMIMKTKMKMKGWKKNDFLENLNYCRTAQ